MIRIKEKIPMDEQDLENCCKIMHLLATKELYVVGGFVRDHMYSQIHGVPNRSKDIDLVTNRTEASIIARLSTFSAEKMGVKIHEKQSVDTFGVVFVTIGDRTYEVAPFRQDIGSADGRRPKFVKHATLEEDAWRRDLTMNALYYDVLNEEIIDIVGGIEDIKNNIVCTVGDPFERFNEDRLRILRLVRFFSRFNTEDIRLNITGRTRQAVKHFVDLGLPGVTGERVVQEFLAGIQQSLFTASYLKNLESLGLFNVVFPKMMTSDFEDVCNIKNTKVVLACMLRDEYSIAYDLQRLKYPAEIFELAHYYACAIRDNVDPLALIKGRERLEIKAGGRHRLHSDLILLAIMIGDKAIVDRIAHFVQYEPPKIDAQALIDSGVAQGPELGRRIKDMILDDYSKSYLESRCGLS